MDEQEKPEQSGSAGNSQEPGASPEPAPTSSQSKNRKKQSAFAKGSWLPKTLATSGVLLHLSIIGLISFGMLMSFSPAFRAFWYAGNAAKSSSGGLNIEPGSHNFTTRERPQFRATAHGLTNFRFRVFRKDFSAFKQETTHLENWQPAAFMLSPSPPLSQDIAVKCLNHSTPIQTCVLPVRGIDCNQGESVWSLDALPPGQYIYVADAPKQDPVIGAFVVTDIGLMLRKSPDNILIKAFDLNTLEPVQAKVEVLSLENGDREVRSVLTSECNPDGICFAKLKVPEHVAVRIAAGKSEALSYWGNYSGGEWMGYGYLEPSAPDWSRDLVTDIRVDRTAYRLGQMVFFRSLLRRNTPAGLSLPAADTPVQMIIRDPEGNEITKSTLRTGPFGDVSGSFRIPENGKTGQYNIDLQPPEGNSVMGVANVIQYRKPEYQVEVLPAQKITLFGDKAKVKVRASYYFGGPVVGAQVCYNTSTSPDWSLRENLRTGAGADTGFFGTNLESVGYYSGGTDTRGTALTGDDGVAEITINTPAPSANSNGPYDVQNMEALMNVSATVTDLSRKTVDAAGSLRITPGQFAVFVEPGQTMLEPGQVITAKVKAVDYDGKPVDCKAALKLIKWKVNNGTWTQSVLHEENNIQVASGKVSMRLPAAIDAGSYFLSLEAKDGNRTIRDTAGVYVLGEVVEDNPEEQTTKIVLNKKVYEQGDTVKALITVPPVSKHGKTVALTSIEGLTIHDYKSVDFSKNSMLVEFPLRDSYLPEVTLSVRTVNKQRKFEEVGERILIYPRSKLLAVDVVSDKKDYHPGDTVNLTVKAKNIDGKPAANTQLAVSVVDESIFAIQPDGQTDINHSFWGSRPNWVTGGRSFDGHAEFTPTEVAWILPLNQVFQGSVSDLNRLNSESPMLLGATNGTVPQPCLPEGAAFDKSVAACAPAAQASRSRAYKDGPPSPEVVVRNNFQDSAYWAPNVVTDASGMAKVKVKIPDNLTEWRATVTGITKTSETGFASSKFKVNKDIMARLSMPRFFTQDDEGFITGIVHNNTNKRQQIKLELASTGQFKVNAPLTQTLTVDSEGAARFSWPIQTVGEGKAQITLKAIGSTDADAMLQKIPVRSFSYPAFACKNGILKGDKETLALPLLLAKDARPGSGKFSVAIAPTAIGPVLGNFDKLIDYPYGCTEQTMSRLVPSVVAMELHKKLGLPVGADTKTKFNEVYKAGILKLIEHHGEDGGWGWWKNDKSSPYLTAYVMEGLFWLKEAGYSVDQSMLDNGLEWLRQHGENGYPVWTVDRSTDDAYCLYVRTLYGDMPTPDAIRKHLVQCSKMSPEGRAYLTLAFYAAGDKAAAGGAYASLSELANKNWEFTDWNHTEAMMKKLNCSGADYTYRFEGVETTALALRAALVMEPKNEKLLSSIRRWILLQKDESGWSNTKSTAGVFLALLQDEVNAAEGKATNYTVTASAGSKTLGSFLFNKANEYSPEKVIDTALDGTEKEFRLTKNGSGRLYYSSLLTYDRPIKPGQVVSGMSSPPDLELERKFFRLQRFKNESGSYVYRAVPVTENGVKAGETILMKLRIKSPIAIPYVMVSAALPACAEVVSQQDPNQLSPHVNDESASADVDKNDESYMSYWWTHQDILDDRMVFFVTNMPEGKSELKALIRMEMPGKFNVNPVTFEAMYTKKIRGYSNSDRIVVNE